ncbi:hypothetical protein BM451_11285, partial [Dickeya dadantii]
MIRPGSASMLNGGVSKPLWVSQSPASVSFPVARVAYRWDGDQLSGQTQYRVDGSVTRAVQWVYEPGSFRP